MAGDIAPSLAGGYGTDLGRARHTYVQNPPRGVRVTATPSDGIHADRLVSDCNCACAFFISEGSRKGGATLRLLVPSIIQHMVT